MYDKILFRKCSTIDITNDDLKNVAQIIHLSHRSVLNFCINILFAIATYSFFEKKLSINVDFCIEQKGGEQTLF
ncbi:hypothetical protein HMPREF0663_10558 [Hoylesella oralis ATCC 33269]|uniref:Uncharacterized protein n=1 Tax=Hoylesella oralis ATCC 33269 TaxID=873533 RepID=E7RN58_9BACT|nr:hypothetical protein HMPREF0663_10558 [Hoylesella oralis ATCC 33269]EPH16545.1 hypothetical protein HMPREF1475_01660 [Hoylesella oralis HGA0225]